MLIASMAMAQVPSGQIAVVDLNRIFNEYYKTTTASSKLKETADGFNKEHEEMMADYRKQIEELNKFREDQDKPEYTQEVRDQKRKAVSEKLANTQKRQREIEEYRASHQRLLEQQTQRMKQSLIKEINEVITREARTRDYLLVLDRSGNTLNGVPSLIYWREALDITDDIVKVLNKEQPKAASSPAKSEEKKSDTPEEKKDEKK